MPALGDQTFTFNGETFTGAALSPVEHGETVEYDNRNQGSAVEIYLIRKTDAKTFRRTALGRATAVDGEIIRENGARHSTFTDLVAQRVSYAAYLPEQPGDDSETVWYMVRVQYGTPKSNPSADASTGSPGDTDAGENRVRWSESWDTSVEAAIAEMEVASGSAEPRRTLLYFPQARVSLNIPSLPLAAPMTYMTTYAGRVNSDALKLPSRQTIPIAHALYTGCSARAQRIEEDGITFIEWDLTHHFLIKPHSWNEVKDRSGTLVNLRFPAGGGAAYESAAMQGLLDDIDV